RRVFDHLVIANDNGEGGPFALYSLLIRHSGLSIGAEAPRLDDINIINYKSESIIGVPNFIERSKFIQNLLIIVVMLSSSLLISDGMLTPAISVISAIEGFVIPLEKMDNIGDEELKMITIFTSW
ncbi:9646_t:CDS:2, partial [Dentiscutata heterogama]